MWSPRLTTDLLSLARKCSCHNNHIGFAASRHPIFDVILCRNSRSSRADCWSPARVSCRAPCTHGRGRRLSPVFRLKPGLQPSHFFRTLLGKYRIFLRTLLAPALLARINRLCGQPGTWQGKFASHDQKNTYDELAGSIAHELSNLLQAIEGYTVYAMEGLSPQEGRYQDLQHVLQAANRASTLARQLLGFRRRTVLERTHIDPNRVLPTADTLPSGEASAGPPAAERRGRGRASG